MNIHTSKAPEKQGGAIANNFSKASRPAEAAFQFVDNRPETIAQRKLQQFTNADAQQRKIATPDVARKYSMPNKEDSPYKQHKDGYTAVGKQAAPAMQMGKANTNAPAIQAFFDLSEFQFAANAFFTAYQNAKRFDDELNDINNTYITEMEGGGTLKNNIEAKGRKASGTVSGESFETREWLVEHEADVPRIIGPGGGDGIDLKEYFLEIEQLDDMFNDELETERRVEITNIAGDDYGEVKSARSTATFLDGVGDALNTNNANKIIMYAAGGITPDVDHAFIRSANRFIIKSHNNMNFLTHRADIEVKSFNGQGIADLTVHDNPIG